MPQTEISWILRAKDSVSKVLASVGKKFAGFAKSGLEFAKKIGGAFALVGGAAVAMGARTIAAYQKQAQAEAKLTSVLRATGYAAGFTTSELKAQAAQLQKQTGIGDEVILSMQGVLATFKEIKGDNFREATAAIMDMSTVMAKAGKDSADVEAASIQVGKALNDPIRGISALSRVGVQFNEIQRTQIREMQESGNIAGAQAVILAELKAQFGGAAEGIDANTKAYRVLRAAVGDFQERIGEALTDNLELGKTFEFLTGKIEELAESGYVELWAENVARAIHYILDNIAPLINAFSKIRNIVQQTGATIGALIEGESWTGARAIARDVVAEMETEKRARLEVIRATRRERDKAKAEEEQQEMAVAQVKQVAIEREEAKLREIQAQRERLNELEKDRNKLLERQKQLIDDMAHQDRIQVQVGEIDQQIAAIEGNIGRIMGRDVGEAIEDQIQRRREGIEAQREVDKRDEEFAAKRARLEARDAGAWRMSGLLTRRDGEWLEAAREHDRAVAMERQERAKIAALEAERDRIQNAQLQELQQIHNDLAKNLQAAGAV